MTFSTLSVLYCVALDCMCVCVSVCFGFPVCISLLLSMASLVAGKPRSAVDMAPNSLSVFFCPR